MSSNGYYEIRPRVKFWKLDAFVVYIKIKENLHHFLIKKFNPPTGNGLLGSKVAK